MLVDLVGWQRDTDWDWKVYEMPWDAVIGMEGCERGGWRGKEKDEKGQVGLYKGMGYRPLGREREGEREMNDGLNGKPNFLLLWVTQ